MVVNLLNGTRVTLQLKALTIISVQAQKIFPKITVLNRTVGFINMTRLEKEEIDDQQMRTVIGSRP